jgi:hypothetical protein
MPDLTLELHPHELAALVDGRLGEVWRPVEPPPGNLSKGFVWRMDGATLLAVDESTVGELESPPHEVPFGDCPLGGPGDRIRVLEEWAIHSQPMEGIGCGYVLEYVADGATKEFFLDGRIKPFGTPPDAPSPWPSDAVDQGPQPASTMPEWASRYSMINAGVEVVVRVQSISEAAAMAAGCCPGRSQFDPADGPDAAPSDVFVHHQNIFHPGHWESNGWAWRVRVREAEGR